MNIAIIGASADRTKFGNKAVRAFASQGYKVFPIHPSAKEIEGWTVYATIAAVPENKLDKVSMYVPPKIGLGLLGDIAKKEVGELWLNPGSESDELITEAEKLGLNVIAACSIVGVGESPSRYGA